MSLNKCQVNCLLLLVKENVISKREWRLGRCTRSEKRRPCQEVEVSGLINVLLVVYSGIHRKDSGEVYIHYRGRLNGISVEYEWDLHY